MTLNTGLFGLVAIGLMFGYVRADCSPSFFARDIKYEDAVEIDFYYTGINLASTKACAAFCAQREFCRSAVYNPRTKTCGISYDYTIACASTLKLVENYVLKDKNSGNLVQIACVEGCKKSNGSKNDKKIPIGIITGEPNDGETKPVPKSPKTPENDDSNTVTDSATTKPTEKPRADGYVTRLILANITGVQEGAVGSIEPLTLHQNDEQSKKETKKPGKSQVCYRTIRHRYLLGAIFELHDVNSINECRCLCAATYRDSEAKNRCQSFQYKAGKCEINKGNHLGKYDLIEKRKTVYQYVDCDIEVLLDVASNFCPNFKITTVDITSTQKPSTTTQKPKKVELITGKPLPEKTEKEKKEKSDDKKKASKSKKTETTTAKPKPTEAPTITTEQPSTTTTEENTTSKVEETTTEKTEAVEEVTTPVKKNRPTGNDVVEKEEEDKLIIKKDECFEVIDDHLMVSVAGGLEHDVSIEECECICANSKKSGKYEFQCASATYYHVERDCILNLEDRNMKSKLFKKQFTNFNVSYIGITCPTEKALETRKNLMTTGCRIPASESETATTIASKTRNQGENTDSCYVELHDFVLEGTAIAVESGASPQECKCKCAEGQKLYGEECASFLYYYDSKTCLINKQNRFTNPEKFNFVPSVNQTRSYFEWTCATKDGERVKYLSDVCKVVAEKVEGNLLNSEGDAEIVKQDAQKVVDNDSVRLRRLDEKEFLKKLEEVVDDRIKLNETKNQKKESSEKKIDKKETKNVDKKVVNMNKISTDDILKKIEEASVILESTTPKAVEVTTTTEKPVESTTTKEKVKTSTEKLAEEKPANEKEVKLKTVDQDELMNRIKEAVEKLEGTTQPVFAPITTQAPATTTTSKLILNTKKSSIATPSPSETKIEQLKSNEVKLKKVDDKEFEALLKQKISDATIIDTVEQEKLNADPKNVHLRVVDPKLLEEMAKMQVVEGPVPEQKSMFGPIFGSSAEKTVPKPTSKPKKYTIPEAEGIEDDVEDDVVEAISSELNDEPRIEQTTLVISTTEAPTTTSPPVAKAKASGVKTHKFDEKVDKEGMPLPLITTPAPTTTTTLGYPSAGRCSYSALYQTAFLGRRLLKTVRVKTPADCFAACFALRCRSANLIAQGDLHSCELYRDSLIDYRRPDMIGYDAATVYFDGINCDGNQ